jgi:hypothetical protein
MNGLGIKPAIKSFVAVVLKNGKIKIGFHKVDPIVKTGITEK